MRKIKRKRNWIVILFVLSTIVTLIALVVAISVLIVRYNKSKNNSVVTLTPNQAIEHLESKYGIKAKACISEESSMDSEFTNVVCIADSIDKDNEGIVVFAMKDNGDIILTDNYFGYLVRPEIEERITDIVQKEFEDCKVYAHIGTASYPGRLSYGNTLNDLYQTNPIYKMNLRIYAKEDSNKDWDIYQNKVNMINQAIINNGWNASVEYFVVNDTVFNNVERYKRDSIIDIIHENKMPDGEKCYFYYENQSLVVNMT